jgi:hypothetical protein
MQIEARGTDEGVTLLVTPRDSMVPRVTVISWPDANRLHAQLGQLLCDAGVTMQSPIDPRVLQENR